MGRKLLCQLKPPHRRGAAVVMVAVSISVLLGFAALAVDVGVIYNARADLQRTADASVLAAAERLGSGTDGNVFQLAKEIGKEIAGRNLVLGQHISLVDSDITFHQAEYDANSRTYTLKPAGPFPDAIRVVARKTSDSPNGPVGLFFAQFLGKSTVDISASATAVLLPRDIAVVADLSGSHTYDSAFRHYKITDINMFDVWDHLPGGMKDDDSVWEEGAVAAFGADADVQAAGPAWGLFETLGFGVVNITSSYNPNTDPGLVRMQKNVNWSDAMIVNSLASLGYSPAEINTIMSGSFDGSGAYPRRSAVAAGWAEWNSGIWGGRWQKIGIPPWQAGNGNGFLDANEITFVERFGDRSASQTAAIWDEYVDYVSSTSSAMYSANKYLRYQFGIKTFVDFLLAQRQSYTETPELAATPVQPMQAVKDSVTHLAGKLESLNGNDHLSLEIYATRGRHEVDLTSDYYAVSNRLNAMQAGYYDSSTNIGAGILRGIEELTSERARTVSRKVMIVLTDGNANTYGDPNTKSNATQAAIYAKDMATAAAARRIQIFTVSVGADSDTALMEQIAQIGGGTHFHAEGTIDEYSDQLDQIFERIGGKRPVALIQ